MPKPVGVTRPARRWKRTTRSTRVTMSQKKSTCVLFCARQYAFRPTSLEQRLTLVYRNPRFKLVPKSKTNCRTAHVGMNVCLCHPRLITVEFAASAGCTSDGGRVRDRFTGPSKFAPVTASYDPRCGLCVLTVCCLARLRRSCLCVWDQDCSKHQGSRKGESIALQSNGESLVPQLSAFRSA